MTDKSSGTLTRSEEVVFKNWPTSLQRKVAGCDFVEAQDGTPVEVKTGILTSTQIRDMKEANAEGRTPSLVILNNSDMLVFQLVRIKDISAEGMNLQAPQLIKVPLNLPADLYEQFAKKTEKGSRSVVIRKLAVWWSRSSHTTSDWNDFPYTWTPYKALVIMFKLDELWAFDKALGGRPRNRVLTYLVWEFVRGKLLLND